VKLASDGIGGVEAGLTEAGPVTDAIASALAAAGVGGAQELRLGRVYTRS